jgi:hypothetical protein
MWTALASAGQADAFEVIDPTGLFGTWTSKQDGRECVISFAKDYTFKGVVVTKDAVETPFEGTWSLSRSSITNGWVCMELRYVYSKFGQLPAGTKDMDLIIDRIIDPNSGQMTLTFRTSNGQKRVYTKSTPPAPTPAKP